MTYRQLTLEQRYLIYKLRKEGYSQKRIAELIRVHPSKVSRELSRNMSKSSYRPKLAHRQAMKRRVMPRIQRVLVPGRKALIRHYLRKGWSPDQIAAHVYAAKKLQADFFFAQPYKPWQRGLNDKTNGLIR